MCSLAPGLPSLLSCLFKFFGQLFKRVMSFYCWVFRVLYTIYSGTRTLSDVQVANISSHCVGCFSFSFFTFLIESFDA